MAEAREVSVALDDMKFSAAHFVAFKGFREPVHGHNYSVGVRIGGTLQGDGYLTDFGDLKKVARKACKQLNQRTLIPTRSDVMTLEVRSNSASEGGGSQVEIRCEGGVSISLPEADCALLPVIHTTAEELAEYLWWEILVTHQLASLLLQRGVQWLEVSVSERPGQGAQYRNAVSLSRSPAHAEQRLAQGRPLPRPCFGQEDPDEGIVAPPPAPAAMCGGGYGCSCGSRRMRHAPDAAATVVPPPPPPPPALSNVEVAEAAFRSLLSTLGPAESSRPELDRTPYRAAKAFREMTAGLQVADPLTAIGQGIFEVEEAQDLVAVRDIPFHSMCEHHLLPFSGIAHIAYYPQGKVLGLSKFPRLLHVFARRLQLQERLTSQFADAVDKLLVPRALAVALEATHGCMCHRGVGVASSTRTLVVRGPGREDRDLRASLLDGVSFSYAAGGAARARL